MADHSYYMVRAMDSGSQSFDLFHDHSVVAVGWSNTDFTKFGDTEKLVEEIEKTYYANAKSRSAVGKKLAQVRRFRAMQEGDRIIVPYWNAVSLAEAKPPADALYDAQASVKTLDLCNQRRVSYRLSDNGKPLAIRRDVLSEGLQRRLRVRGSTVLDLAEFAREIEGLFARQPATWDRRYLQEEEKARIEARNGLLARLQRGQTNLRAGGIGMEELVKELLETEGYVAEILPKRRFPPGADADIKATRADPFSPTSLLVQVKHHQGQSGAEAALQLVNAAQSVQGADYSLVVVTSAEASQPLKDACDAEGIDLMAGNDFAEWLYEALPKLGKKTRLRLGVSAVPMLLDL